MVYVTTKKEMTDYEEWFIEYVFDHNGFGPPLGAAWEAGQKHMQERAATLAESSDVVYLPRAIRALPISEAKNDI